RAPLLRFHCSEYDRGQSVCGCVPRHGRWRGMVGRLQFHRPDSVPGSGLRLGRRRVRPDLQHDRTCRLPFRRRPENNARRKVVIFARPRASDRNIAAMAADTGVYRPSEHRAMAEAGHVRVPGGDFDGYIGSHVRRLEALRRAGIVERLDGDRWTIPVDYEARATAYDTAQSRRMNLRVLSAYDLDRQISSDGATWLDRELVSPNRTTFTQAGFGSEVSRALERRKDSLVDQGLASRTPEGGLRVPRDLLSRLEQQEIARVGPEMAKARGLTFKPAEVGNHVSGTLVGAANLGSGKFAMIDDGLGFSLVPWQPVLEQRLGRQITGVAMPGAGIDWTFGRSRGLGL